MLRAFKKGVSTFISRKLVGHIITDWLQKRAASHHETNGTGHHDSGWDAVGRRGTL